MSVRFKTPPAFLKGLFDVAGQHVPLRGEGAEQRTAGVADALERAFAWDPDWKAANPPTRPRKPRIEWSKALLAQLQAAGHVGWKRELRFHPTRMWRFDCAHTELMIAIEVEGMKGSGKNLEGGHRGIKGFRNDLEKYGEAFALGWTILRVSTRDVTSGRALRRLEARLARG